MSAIDGLTRESATKGPSIERDDLFDLLGNHRRRYVIEFLRDRRESTTLDTLAVHVAARETGSAVDAVAAADRKRVYTSLQQTHLPRLDELGVISFDKERGVVTPSDQLAECTLHLDIVSKSTPPQSAVFIVLSALGLCCFVGVVLSLPGLAALSPFHWGALVLLAFGVVATSRRVLDARGGPSPGPK